ncbi:MAG: carboxypeptidase regulatory-like domain-containing protein [Clostridiales Family XIII bacterium]|jgi:hypothetical protein|nr:carboxypeptidase regulatory-like domain-containing protein [Clostridiales Family XIII bacterium]
MSTKSKSVPVRFSRILLSVFLLAVLVLSLLPAGSKNAAYADAFTGTITGTVIGSDGTPVAGALLHVSINYELGSSPPHGISDGNGDLIIPEGYDGSVGVPPGDYVLRFSGGFGNSDDYFPSYYAGNGVVGLLYDPDSDENFDAATKVTVTAGANKDIGTFVLQKKPSGSIQGNLVDNTGTPIIDGTVYAYDVNNVNTIYTSAQTNSNGDYNLKYLADGDYIVRFSPPYSSPELVSNYYNGALDGAAVNAGDAVPITIASENTHTGIDGKLYVGGSISGTVRDVFTTPLANAYVLIYKKVPDSGSPGGFSYDIVTFFNTPAGGTYEKIGLAPGAYVVLFSGPANAYLDQYYNGLNFGRYTDVDQDTATEIPVSYGDVITCIDAALLDAPTGSISGTVTDNTFANLDNADVTLYSTDGKTYLDNTSTDASGYYEFENVPDGSYIVKFMAPYGTNLAPQYYDDSDTLAGATLVVVVGGGATPGIDASLRIGGTISGVITDANDSPLEDIFAVAFLKTATDYEMITFVTSAADGSYEITGVSPGQCCVLFLDLNGEQYLGQLYNDKNFVYDYSDNDAIDRIDFSPATEIPVAVGVTTQNINAKLVKELPPPGGSNSIKITPDKFSVNVGGSIAVKVGLYNQEGNYIQDLTNVATITSDHATDKIAGGKVTFPSASTHIIKAEYAGLSDQVSIKVNPNGSNKPKDPTDQNDPPDPDVTPTPAATADGGNSPRTGDEMRPNLLIAAGAISLTSLFVLIAFIRLAPPQRALLRFSPRRPRRRSDL